MTARIQPQACLPPLCRVIELLDQPAFVLDEERALTSWNRAGASLLGLDANDREELSDSALTRLARFEALLACADGPFMMNMAALDGERTYFVEMSSAEPGVRTLLLRDETALVDARRALSENEQRFGAITDAALDAMLVMDPRGRVRFWNAAAEQIFGWSAAEALGRDLHELLAPADQQAAFHARHRGWQVDGRSPIFGKVQRLPAWHRDGHRIDVELSLTAFRAKGEWQAFGIVRDITGKLSEEMRLREAEERWQFALEGGGDAVWDWNIASGTAVFGPGYKAMLGYADDEFEDSFEAFYAHVHPDDQPRVGARLDEFFALGASGNYRCDLRMRCRDGSYRWIHARGRVSARGADGTPLRMVGTHRDITEQRSAEEALQRQLGETQRLNARLEEVNVQLLQSDKMASIGQLAAGVAHEMNTPLAFVGSNLGTLENYVGKLFAIAGANAGGPPQASAAGGPDSAVAAEMAYLAEDLPALFRETRDGIDRVRRIVADLKDFSRIGDPDWGYHDIHRGLDSTINILRNEIKHKAEVVREYAAVPELWCIPSQLNQVFMNLLLNATQAIEREGRIVVRTRADAEAICVDVIDNGRGIDAATLNRIFEPFYTTKPVGQGTGLGLSIAYGIVRRHGGRIEVDSAPGRGSRFTLVLPLRSVTPSSEKHDD